MLLQALIEATRDSTEIHEAINCEDVKGQTPLIVAAYKGNYKAVELVCFSCVQAQAHSARYQ